MLKFLCAVVVLTAPLLANADAAEELKNRIDQIHDLKGHFTQVLSDKGGEILQSSRGEFALKRPDYFLWQSAAPYEQTVIGTPEKIWVYDPDLEQATVRSADEQAGHNPARLLSGDLREVRSNYEVSSKGTGAQTEYHLVPRSPDSPYRYIEFAFRKDALAGLRFQDKLDQVTRIEFDKLQLNSNIPADAFTFDPPPGTDVIVDD